MVKGNWTATVVAAAVATLLYSCGDDDNPVGLPDELQVQGCTDIAATNSAVVPRRTTAVAAMIVTNSTPWTTSESPSIRIHGR